jgi:predicted deacetylase
MTTRFVIRFDDVTLGMAWSKFAPFDALAQELNIPYLIGVVPDCRDPALSVEPHRADFWDFVRERVARGWTVAQHGHTHHYVTAERGLLGIGKKSEFAGLPFAEQKEKLAAGKDNLVREGVWQPVFMAPSHSFDENTLKALDDLGFESLTDGYGFYPYRIKGLLAVPQLSSKPIGFGFGVETVCLHVNTLSVGQIDRQVATLRARRGSIISFPEALKVVAPVPLIAPVVRVASEVALKTFRRVRG